ncbi:MAG: polysaccharide biosynthesis/export family protein [Blastocatellia bacterium]
MKTSALRIKPFAIGCLSLFMLLVSPVFGQQPVRQGAPATNRPTAGSDEGASQVRPKIGPDVIIAADEDYRLSPSDVIEVIIQDAPELSGNFQISSSGNIPMYYLGSMKVEGRTPDEVSKMITDGLRGRYLKDPKVFVSVKQYNSRTFFIQGAVKSPGVYIIQGRPSLFKLITIAGGLQDKHGSMAYIVREVKASPEKLEARGQKTDQPAPVRSTPVTEAIDNAKGSNVAIEGETDFELLHAKIGGLSKGRFDQNLLIQPGDVVYIPPAEVFYVSGEVRAPGQYQYREGMTLRQAITLSQGPYFKAKLDKGIIFREDPLTGKFSEIPVNIASVLNKGGEDIPIYPNDIITVPNSGVKSVAGALMMALGVGVATRIPVGVR